MFGGCQDPFVGSLCPGSSLFVCKGDYHLQIGVGVCPVIGCVGRCLHI